MYTKALFDTLVVFLIKWVQIKNMIHPYKKMTQINVNKPARQHQSENERAQIKKWCIFV
jgi:hypothetical protein